MGIWTADVSGRFEPLPGPNIYGHRFIVSLRLNHRSIPGEPLHRYAETPYLAWKEEITSKDFGSNTFFQWKGDLYRFRPDARTFTAWRERYLEAYRRANRTATLFDFLNGSSTLLNRGQLVTDTQIRAALSNAALPLRTLAQNRVPLNNEQAAQAVRAYIHHNNCELRVEVLDRPALGTGNQNRNVERLLLFDCGVAGTTARAHQLIRTYDLQTSQFRPNGQAQMNYPAQTTLPLDGFTPDVGQTLDHQYSDLLTSANALSLQADNHLGGGSYR